MHYIYIYIHALQCLLTGFPAQIESHRRDWRENNLSPAQARETQPVRYVFDVSLLFRSRAHCRRAGCAQVSDKTLSPVTALTSLTSLDMSSCASVDDEAVLIVSKLPQLKSLSLSFTDISDGSLAVICGGQIRRRDEKSKPVLIDYTVSRPNMNDIRNSFFFF